MLLHRYKALIGRFPEWPRVLFALYSLYTTSLFHWNCVYINHWPVDSGHLNIWLWIMLRGQIYNPLKNGNLMIFPVKLVRTLFKRKREVILIYSNYGMYVLIKLKEWTGNQGWTSCVSCATINRIQPDCSVFVVFVHQGNCSYNLNFEKSRWGKQKTKKTAVQFCTQRAGMGL